jgi:hypothetical protein
MEDKELQTIIQDMCSCSHLEYIEEYISNDFGLKTEMLVEYRKTYGLNLWDGTAQINRLYK